MSFGSLVAQETTKSLYVIDGKVVSKAEFDQLKPETIQNVDIFKNIEGAVVVTTKSNASGVEGLRGKLQSKTVRIKKQDGSAMVEENDEKVLIIGESSVVTTTKSKKTEMADPLILQKKKKDGEIKVLSPDAIKKMDPNTIQAVSVLKDDTTEAYAKYGDVTNGVIVIELK